MKAVVQTIDPEVAAVLGRATVDGPRLQLHEQLDRKTYQRVAKTIELLGGKWNRKAGAHLFDEDVSELLADALMTGTVVDIKKTYQVFPTPRDLADELVALASVRATDTVLEPSAGTGRIVESIRRAKATVLACEIQTRHHDVLAQMATVVGTDFMDVPVQDGRVTKVVANPPFARGQDVAHVRRMAQWLEAKGGMLVSVMSPAWTFRQTAAHVQFRAWAEKVGAQWVELPADTFAESGTGVRAGIFLAEIAAGGR